MSEEINLELVPIISELQRGYVKRQVEAYKNYIVSTPEDIRAAAEEWSEPFPWETEVEQ